MWQAILLILISYLIGTLPNAQYVAKLAGHDVYKEGSKNPGASNVARIAGWKWGILAIFLDALKGLIPTLVALTFTNRAVAYLSGMAAVLGHIFPLLRKGGKGVATAAGVALALYPIAGIVVISLWAVLMKTVKIPVVASMAAALVFTLWVGIFHYYLWEFFVVIILFGVLLLRHIPNIKRLIKGNEQGV